MDHPLTPLYRYRLESSDSILAFRPQDVEGEICSDDYEWYFCLASDVSRLEQQYEDLKKENVRLRALTDAGLSIDSVPHSRTE